MVNMECPVCEKGTLKKAKIHESLFGADLGDFLQRSAIAVEKHLLMKKQPRK